MHAGVIVRCERMYAKEFLGNQVRELSSLFGEKLELLSLNYREQVIGFIEEFDPALTWEKAERLRLMTRSFDSEIVVRDGIAWQSPGRLAVQMSAQVDRLSETKSGHWNPLGWRPLVWGSLHPRAV